MTSSSSSDPPRGGVAHPATTGAPIRLDGSFGEGGGQILRTSLSLSALTGRPLRLEKSRAGREKPGLKRQHLTAVKAAAAVCGARVEGAELGSMALAFDPGAIRGGSFRFDVGSAGSAILVAQTVLPVLLRAPEPSEVEITGGTHVSFAPNWEVVRAFLPDVRIERIETPGEKKIRFAFPSAEDGAEAAPRRRCDAYP